MCTRIRGRERPSGWITRSSLHSQMRSLVIVYVLLNTSNECNELLKIQKKGLPLHIECPIEFQIREALLVYFELADSFNHTDFGFTFSGRGPNTYSVFPMEPEL